MSPSVILGATLALIAFAYRAALLGAPEPPSQLPDVEEFFFTPSGGSPGLIFAATAWMLTSRWRRLRSTVGGAATPRLGALMLGGAAILFLWAQFVDVAVLLVPSLSLLLIAVGFLIGGVAGARVLLLPASFLLLAVPIPSVLLNQLIFPMQLATARWTTALLNGLGLTAWSHAEFIVRENALFQVIESCSGLRMIETLVMTAILYSELFRTNRIRTIILLISAPLVSIVCNQIRVMSIVLNPYSDFAAVHTTQGLVMIVVGVLLLATVDGLAGRLLGDRLGQRRPWRVRLDAANPPFATLATLLGVAAAFAVASVLLPRWESPARAVPSLAGTLPSNIGEWSARGLKTDTQFLGSARYDEGIARRYWRGEEQIDVFLARDFRLDPAQSLISPKTELSGPWSVVLSRESTNILGRDATRLLISGRGDRQVVYHLRLGVGPFRRELGRVLLALDRGPFRRAGHALVLRVGTSIPTSVNGEAEADARLISFLAEAEHALQEIFEAAEAASEQEESPRALNGPGPGSFAPTLVVFARP